MGQHLGAAIRQRARCSRSTPMAQVLPTCIVLRQSLVLRTAMELILMPVCFCPATRCTGRQMLVALRATARDSGSTPMAQASRTFIVSRQLLTLHKPTTTDLVLVPVSYCPATPCTGRHPAGAVRVMARCSGSTPMARALQTCILSPAATELCRRRD